MTVVESKISTTAQMLNSQNIYWKIVYLIVYLKQEKDFSDWCYCKRLGGSLYGNTRANKEALYCR